jgi:hypothetical protein
MAHRTELQTNDNMELVPVTAFDGPALELDFPALRIGVAEYGEGPTGCTVFYFPEGVSTAVDMRGGAIGASETFYGRHHAICFAGGSAFGLEVVSGVRAEPKMLTAGPRPLSDSNPSTNSLMMRKIRHVSSS